MQLEINDPKTEFDARRTPSTPWPDTLDMLAAASQSEGLTMEWLLDYQSLDRGPKR
ncbi:MAG: hypothetical protein ACSHWS_15885 [Sulfitobacter sp.]